MAQKRRRAAVYARVSTEDQAEKGYSLESQVDACLKRAEEMGFASGDVAVFTDDVSGTVSDRPGLNRLREWCAGEDRPEAVLVYDPDRLARKLSLQLMVTDEWLKRGIILEFVNFEWTDTPEGRMFYQLRGMFAEFEREKIRERTIRGRLTKLKTTGKLSGDPRLYGYRFDTEQDMLVVDPDSAGTVKRIFQWAAGGCSGEEIARRLAKEGIPAPRGSRWHGSTVTRILHNRSYLGEYKAYKTDYHQGYKRKRPESEQFSVPIEPLVEPELFEEAGRTLLRTRTRTGRPSKRETLLSGLVRCSCGRSMMAGGASARRGYAYYICSSKLKASYPVHDNGVEGEVALPSKCSNVYWNTSVTDDVVWNELVRMLTDNRKAWSVHIGSGFHTGPSRWEADYAKEKLAAAEGKLRRLVELFVSDGISRGLYDEKRASLEQEIERWRTAIEASAAGLNDNGGRGMGKRKEEGSLAAAEPWFESDHETEVRLHQLPYATRKQVLPLLLERVELHPDRTLCLIYRFPLP